MEYLIGLFKRIAANVVAVVAICIFIAAAPLISIGVVVGVERNPHNADILAWFTVACPFCVGIWYMFIATMTRYARAKYFGVTPRNGFLWVGSRLFGGWLLSQAVIIGIALVVKTLVDGGQSVLTPQTVAPLFLLAVWSPVLVNLTRHFMRRYPIGVSGISAPSPVVGQ